MSRLLPIIFTVLTIVGSAPAQTTGVLALEVSQFHDSGTHTNADQVDVKSVYTYNLEHADAASMRVLFGEITLGPGDWIEVYSPFDGQRQILNDVELAKWENTSAYFNGDKVIIDLFLQPGSTGSFEVAGYIYGLGGGSNAVSLGTDTICGNDDRVPSTDNRSGRFVSSPTVTGGGCTIWIASADSCAVSAGHCFSGGSLMVAEFNVPASLSSGALQHPPVDDQFTIDTSTLTFNNNGLGDDWGVVKLNTNNLGQTAAQRYGHYNVASFIPNPNDTIRITGYGTDSGVDNQTNQTNSGPYDTTTGTRLRYVVDTTGGNSGSPVIFESTGEVVGVHTNGGCTSTGGSNSGTSLSNVGFQAAFSTLCQTTATAPPVASFTQTATSVVAGQSVSFTSTSSNFPTSYAWDFDGDGTTDATTSSASFTYTTAGTFDVSLTVTNALGSDTLTVTGAVTVNPLTPASLPYSQDFNAGLPTGGEWTFVSEPGGRILATIDATPSPNSGGNALVMDATTQSAAATNDSTLFLDLTGTTQVFLTYWWRETSDENDPEDGVFFSDGVTEILAFSHNDGPSVWTEQILDVTTIAQAAGLTLDSNFRIIFRQRDNFPLGIDGVLIDDIDVVDATGGGGQPNSAGAFLIVTGAVDGQGLPATAAVPGPFTVQLSPGDALSFDVGGDPTQPFLLLMGPLNVGNASFSIGQMDIGLLGPADLSDVGLLLNGLTPLTFLDTLANTGPAGVQSMSFTVPSLPPGTVGAIQAAVYRAASGLPLLTAATDIVIL